MIIEIGRQPVKPNSASAAIFVTEQKIFKGTKRPASSGFLIDKKELPALPNSS